MDPSQSQEVIARLKETSFEPRFKHIKGRYLFIVDGVGSWRIHADEGRLQVFDGPGEADLTVRCSPEDFIRIAKGEQNLITAFMQGRVEIEGDPVLAQKLHGILPSPQKAGVGVSEKRGDVQ